MVSSGLDISKNKTSVRRKHRRAFKRNSNRRSRRKRSLLRYYMVDITDMEWTPVSSPATEVAEWHKQEQIAYWKSRALSFEYENKMLIRHLRNVYAKQTEDYANYVKEQGQIEDKDSETRPILPTEPVGKKRREEMDKLYGKKASKIMGMETAVQLNYDLHLEDAGKLAHWPHTPLNLRFDN
ncbi:gem-associated protein 8 [Tribolium castaneum]|uniref:gem-associated protein 8 n=1 Tax=Tribolium castaneum TaxID=7070 RepID=UPI0030FEBBEF